MAETSTSSGGSPSLPMQGVPQPSREEVMRLPRVHISSHPVMKHKMTALRDKNTPPPAFYNLVKEIGALLAYEATSDLALEQYKIETPMAPMMGERLAGGAAGPSSAVSSARQKPPVTGAKPGPAAASSAKPGQHQVGGTGLVDTF